MRIIVYNRSSMSIDGRFPLGVLLVFLFTTWMPAEAWPRVPYVQWRSSTKQREDSAILSNLGVDIRGGTQDGTDRAVQRSLAVGGFKGGRIDNGDEAGIPQGHPSVEEATRRPVGRADSGSDINYLNGLVESTASDTGKQVADVAFVKTHKTASTTLAAIMYRYAARHDLKLSHFGHATSVSLKSAAAQTQESRELVDVMHYHITIKGQYKGNWDEAAKYYRNIMRHPNKINFVTVLREPRSHLLSYYYYYIQPKNQLSIEEFLMHPTDPNDKDHELLLNPLSAEFGVRTQDDLDSLIKETLPDFKLIILTERLDEGLLVLRRMLRWHMMDLTYCDLNETKAGKRRWDGKPFVDRPHFDSLPKQVQEKIDALTGLDQVLYDAGRKEFEKRLAPFASSMEEDKAQFQELQSIIGEYLDSNSSSMANTMYRSMNVYKEPPDNFPF